MVKIIMASMKNALTLTRPDDWHTHLRDGQFLSRTVHDASRYLGRLLAMPNLIPPLTEVTMISAYRQAVLRHIPHGSALQPFFTLYLTDKTTRADIQAAKQSNIILGCKLYPAGVTTNAGAGVKHITALYPIFAELERQGLVLNLHGEISDPHADIFDRETLFIEQILMPLLQAFPGLKVVLEHISTQTAVDFIHSQTQQIAATITPQHLLFNRNDLLSDGIKPHRYCLPILKRHSDQVALLKAATSGSPRFFMGTDSAPHCQSQKESACGCAGIYSAHASIELYAQIFEAQAALDKLEAFTSFYGADFYGLPRNQDKITLQKQAWLVPPTLPYGDNALIPLAAGQMLDWQLLL